MSVPNRYRPDNLGEKTVYTDANGTRYVYLPPAALRYLGAEDGDTIVFTEGGIDDNLVTASVLSNSRD